MDQQTNDLIKNEIENNEICLFMKGTPDAPQCGFSMAVVNIFKILEVNFKSVNVLENQNIREGIKVYSDWPTIPQLYVKNEFVGGCDGKFSDSNGRYDVVYAKTKTLEKE